MASASQCIPCKRGYFCKFTSMRADARYVTFSAIAGKESYTLANLLAEPFTQDYYAPCAAGYICKEGSSMPNPSVEATDNGYPCPAGYFCQTGFVVEKPCEPGTYNPNTLQGACLDCPAGKYCPNFAMTAGITCIAGHYCPLKSISPQPCPAGTYIKKNADGTNKVGLSASSECAPCDATSYCENIGDTQVSGPCAAGFVCGTGMDRPGPYVTVHNPLVPGSTGRCPAKAMCT